MLGGIPTKALIHSGAEITCISEDFLKQNEKIFKSYPTLPVNGVIVKGPVGGRIVRLKKQLFIDVTLPTGVVQIIFIVVPALSRPCIIGIDVLEELKSHINFAKKTVIFSGLQGSPTMKLICEDEEEKFGINNIIHINHLQGSRNLTDISDNDIDLKMMETGLQDMEYCERLRNILHKYRNVFRRQLGLLNTYTHKLKIMNEQPFFAKSYPVPLAHRNKVDEEI